MHLVLQGSENMPPRLEDVGVQGTRDPHQGTDLGEEPGKLHRSSKPKGTPRALWELRKDEI